jgi:hypothetical protein
LETRFRDAFLPVTDSRLRCVPRRNGHEVETRFIGSHFVLKGVAAFQGGKEWRTFGEGGFRGMAETGVSLLGICWG